MGRHRNSGAPAQNDAPDLNLGAEESVETNESESPAQNDAPNTETVIIHERRDFKSIDSEEDAVEYVRQYFNVPSEIKTVFVSQDLNVFYRANTATLHAKQNNVKLFAIKWD